MRRENGFTLIELVTVMGILAILASATVALINPLDKLLRARDLDRVTAIKNIKNAIDAYITLHDGVPPSCDQLGSCPTSVVLDGNDSLSNALLSTNQLKTIPVPPNDAPPGICDYIGYLYPSDSKDYQLRWCYESWVEGTVDKANQEGYLCQWNQEHEVAVCYTNRVVDIPAP